MGKWGLVVGYIGDDVKSSGDAAPLQTPTFGWGSLSYCIPKFLQAFVFLPHMYSTTAPLQRVEANSSAVHPNPSLSPAQSMSRISSSAAITFCIWLGKPWGRFIALLQK